MAKGSGGGAGGGGRKAGGWAPGERSDALQQYAIQEREYNERIKAALLEQNRVLLHAHGAKNDRVRQADYERFNQLNGEIKAAKRALTSVQSRRAIVQSVASKAEATKLLQATSKL
jgi:hypothetical protein